jgi:drug/metabolite transporter (DMT)-like permease
VLIAIFSAIIFKEHLTRRQGLGIGLAGLGTFIVITGGTLSFQGESGFFLGTLILLATPFLWATYTLLGKKIMEKYNPFLIVAYVNVLGGWFLLPFSLAQNSFHQIFALSLNVWMAILFLAVTCSLVGYSIWFYVIKQVGPVITSSFMFAEPLVTVLFAFQFAGEKLSLLILFGGLLIFAGVLLVVRKRRT